MDKELPLAGQVGLITGASRGYGAAIAKALAGAGMHVVLLARTVGGLEAVDDAIAAGGGTATLIPFDLLKTEEIAGLGPALYERFGRLDMFVANAGMLGHFGPVAHFDNKMWDRVIALNLTANHRLIQTLDPLLRVAEHGRAVFVTDVTPHAYAGAYAVAKAGLEKAAHLYAAETRKTRLRVNLVAPGPMRTMLRAQGYPGEDRNNLAAPEQRTNIFIELADPASIRHGELIILA
jgi:NAD(P)-dependent dehydrogenase (short-subunit alcohol dehydrogenase family)